MILWVLVPAPYSHSASLHPGKYMSTGNLMLRVTLPWAGIPSREGSRVIPIYYSVTGEFLLANISRVIDNYTMLHSPW